MRTAILALAVLGLAAGCGGEAPAPAADAAAGLDPAVERVVEDWALPATMPGSAQPALALVDGPRLLLSWLNAPAGRRPALQFSSYSLAGMRWETAPTTIAVGASMFVNWADTPHLMATRDGALWAHWLQKNGDAPYAYDVALAVSRDGGRSWSEPVTPHRDGTRTEHGFVSMWPRPEGGLGIAWLDGRATAAPDHADGDGGDSGHHHGEGRTMLRATTYDAGLVGSAETVVDASVCDCCQTSAVPTPRGALLVYRGRTGAEVRDILAVRLEGEAWTAPVAVHADGWVTAACPVNGPAVDAHGEAALVAWYTEAAGTPEVRAARSDDAGDSFGEPVVLDAGDAVHGRVAVAFDGAEAWIAWVREDAGGQSLWLSRRSPDLATEHQRLQVAALSGRGRATGFPQLELHGGIGYLVWTDVAGGVAGLRGARIVPR